MPGNFTPSAKKNCENKENEGNGTEQRKAMAVWEVTNFSS